MRKILLIATLLMAASASAAEPPRFEVQARDSFLSTEAGEAGICTVRIDAVDKPGQFMLFSVPQDCAAYLTEVKEHEPEMFGKGAVVNYTINGNALNVI